MGKKTKRDKRKKNRKKEDNRIVPTTCRVFSCLNEKEDRTEKEQASYQSFVSAIFGIFGVVGLLLFGLAETAKSKNSIDQIYINVYTLLLGLALFIAFCMLFFAWRKEISNYKGTTALFVFLFAIFFIIPMYLMNT